MATDSKRSESVGGNTNSHGNSSNNSSKRLSGQRHLSDPAASYEAAGEASTSNGGQHQGGLLGQHAGQDPDLFAILSSMHLTNQLNSLAGGQVSAAQLLAMPHPVLVASRKRKILDAGGHSGFSGGVSGKINGTRHPAHRRNSDEEEAPLQTPNCSQSGYADEEDRHATEAESLQNQKPKRSSGFMPPSPPSPEIHDIVDDNLAADFDGSLSGLGVDIHTASFSMSEALNALPNLSISSSQIFKQEIPSPPSKNEQTNGSPHAEHQVKPKKNYGGALDLSNDEAYLPESSENANNVGEDSGPMTFTGSVSRESTPVSLNFSQQLNRLKPSQSSSQDKSYIVNLSASNPNLSSTAPHTDTNNKPQKVAPQKVILPLQTSNHVDQPGLISQDNMKLEKRSYETIAINELEAKNIQPQSQNQTGSILSENFQYILAASTSTATKLNEPSITYLNQGQAYELRMKKLGDLSSYRSKKLLKCVLRICFHERRLQYMEAEQIKEWSLKHPGERIIDVDLPLSYGVYDPHKDTKNINCLSFKWDPTRDTGIFIKVNCISTEFTPKKHGGEKGVPFRLQVETHDSDGSRIHAAGCILQVFKLKGADRKHKQDRDKINKRPLAEQEKFSPSFDCTVLADLPLEHIYVPANFSRPNSPATGGSVGGVANSTVPTSPVVTTIEVAAQATSGSAVPLPLPASLQSSAVVETAEDPLDNIHIEQHIEKCLEHSALPSQVSSWLVANRFSAYLASFRNFDGRDMLRLSREETIALCGPGDGIRLFNNLNCTQVPPKTVIYVGSKDACDNEYSAIYLDNLTVSELLRKLTEAFEMPDLSLYNRAFLIGPKGIYVHFTDSVVRHLKSETVFQFSLRSAPLLSNLVTDSNNSNSTSNGNHSARTPGFDVIFEQVTSLLDASNNRSSPTHNSNSN